MAKSIAVPEYILDNLIRHIERVLDLGQPKDNRPKAADAFRLARLDVAQLKRIKQRQE